MASAFLVLDDGRIFEGTSWAATGKTFGEAVFQTGMTGYQETLTDPSYHKQVVIMTAPHVGNTGVNDADNESAQIWVAGFVVRNPSSVTSNWRAQNDLEAELIAQGIVGIQGVDTRAITRHLRDRGSMRVGIFSGLELSREYTYRYGKKHKSQEIIEWCLVNKPQITDIGFTIPPKAMPDEYKTQDVIESYRKYYLGAKKTFLTWKERQVPDWVMSEYYHPNS